MSCRSLLRNPARFGSSKQNQYKLVCQEESRLLNLIDDVRADIYIPKKHLEKYKPSQDQIEKAHLETDRKKHYLHNLIQTANLVEQDENEAQKVRQRIKDLQTQIMDLELENHENETQIDELETQRIKLEREIEELKTQKMDLKPENHENKARTHRIEKNPNAANVYCVNLNN